MTLGPVRVIEAGVVVMLYAKEVCSYYVKAYNYGCVDTCICIRTYTYIAFECNTMHMESMIDSM